MDKISLLIFSRNDLDNAWSLIEEMKTVAGEIILMDSSNSVCMTRCSGR